MALSVPDATPPGRPELGAFTASPYLLELIADTERLAARCVAADPSRRAAEAARRRDGTALASLRLDGSPIEAAPTADAVTTARTTVDAATLEDPRRGTWFDAMRAFDGVDPDDPEAVAHDASVHALEFDGVAAANDADDLADALLTDPVPTLAELHRRLTLHLVAPDRAGRLREVEQAVHDASVGRIMYFTADPAVLADELEHLAAWLTASGRDEHGVVVSGIVHLELLRLHPFDAANGRLARAAARLLLRARGLDPDGLAAPEVLLDQDRLGYHDEVARTLRRRDAGLWLERWAEAVADGLRGAARELGQLGGAVPERSGAFVAARAPGTVVTVADHREETGLDPEASRAELRALLDARLVTRVPGSRGLRFTVV
ncbi:Fic family protein [Nitriliruptor alkaliphilus]|uniref:Fic family protein n=1 Tax=Nitriliruptor alkaliphilus TaxID=427918 RepID=UPI0006970322|nr:Fic family protein [Nitriliruptor alkaliphilus]